MRQKQCWHSGMRAKSSSTTHPSGTVDRQLLLHCGTGSLTVVELNGPSDNSKQTLLHDLLHDWETLAS